MVMKQLPLSLSLPRRSCVVSSLFKSRRGLAASGRLARVAAVCGCAAETAAVVGCRRSSRHKHAPFGDCSGRLRAAVLPNQQSCGRARAHSTELDALLLACGLHPAHMPISYVAPAASVALLAPLAHGHVQ